MRSTTMPQINTDALLIKRAELVEITEQSHKVRLDIAYATARNFTGHPVYSRAACFLHPEAEAALSRAIRYASELGYGLIIFDAYRPTEAQWALWNHTPDPHFLANPERGSPHSRGVAVDLNLLDAQGDQLDMGTAFDAFTPLSHHGATDISPDAKRNRLLLMGIMTAAGFDFYRNEWWHYQLFHSRTYPALSDSEAGTRMMELP
jgi:zinc D-Ala-D-Ala dipeptidase